MPFRGYNMRREDPPPPPAAAPAAEPQSKRLRSLPPDVVVSVSGVEFPCYKIALCFASDYFDAMLSAGMREDQTGRIELPGKNPEEWVEFYKIIDPGQIGAVESASIDEENAVMLTRWFHEFSMEAHLKKCDDVLSAKAEEISRWEDKQRGKLQVLFWHCRSNSGSFAERRECFRRLLDLLQHACKYDLPQTKHEVELTLGSIMKNKLRSCLPLFDVDAVRELVQLCLPVTNENLRLTSNGRLISSGPCQNLWEKHLSGFLTPQRVNITAEMVNGNEMFPLLLHSYMQQFVLKETRASETRVRLRENRPNALRAIDVRSENRARFIQGLLARDFSSSDSDVSVRVMADRSRAAGAPRPGRVHFAPRGMELHDSSSSSDSEGELPRAPPPEDDHHSSSDSDSMHSSSSEQGVRIMRRAFDDARRAMDNLDDDRSSQDSDQSDSDSRFRAL